MSNNMGLLPKETKENHVIFIDQLSGVNCKEGLNELELIAENVSIL